MKLSSGLIHEGEHATVNYSKPSSLRELKVVKRMMLRCSLYFSRANLVRKPLGSMNGYMILTTLAHMPTFYLTQRLVPRSCQHLVSKILVVVGLNLAGSRAKNLLEVSP